jgi:hypothetical protein
MSPDIPPDIPSDNRAISSANLLENLIGIDQAKALATILKEHPTLKSLCGNRGDETKLDMSGKEIGVEGAIMLAPEISDNGAMTSLNLASNNIGNEGAKAVANAIKVSTWILLLWFAWHRLTTIIICWRLFWIANIHRTREEPTNC